MGRIKPTSEPSPNERCPGASGIRFRLATSLILLAFVFPSWAEGMNATLVSPPPKEAKPGEFVTHVFKVDNSSDSSETYDLEAVSSNNWNIIGLMPSIKISPGKRIFVPLTVQVPPGTLAGTEDVLSLTLRPRDDMDTILTGSATTRVILVPGVGIAPLVEKSGRRGEALEYAVTVENRGNGQDTFGIAVHSALGWRAEVSPQQVTIAPQASAEVYIKHFIPQNAEPGAIDSLTITVTSMSHPQTSDHRILRTTALGPTLPPPPDKDLFYIIPGSFKIGFPTDNQMTGSFGATLNLAGPVNDKLRIALDVKGWADPGQPGLAIDPRSIRVVGDNWGISWGKPPANPLAWLPRPDFTRGITVNYQAGQVHWGLTLGQRDSTRENEPDRLAEVALEVPVNDPATLKLSYSSLYRSRGSPLHRTGLLGIEGNYSPRQDIALDVGYGLTLAEVSQSPLRMTRIFGVRFGGKSLSAGINYKGTTPGPAEYGSNLYEVSIGASPGPYRIQGSAGYKDEYGPSIPSSPQRVTTSSNISLDLGQAVRIFYGAQAIRSKDPGMETGDELSSSGGLRIFHRFATSTLTGAITQKEVSYPSSLETSYQETDIEFGWQGRLGATPLGLNMQMETRRFLTGETSEELELGIDSEVYLMGGRMRLSPSLSLKESRDHGFPQRAFHIGFSGEAALNFTDNLLFSCKFTQDLTGLGGDAIGLSRIECSLGLAHTFDILIPKATSVVKAIVFEDKNGNGLLDKGDGESGLTGIRLVLNGIKEVTGPDGVAIFRNLSAGTYSLSLDVSSVPITMNYLFRSRKITLSGRDSQEVLMPLFRGATIQGHVTLEAGGSLPPGPGSIGIKAVSCALPAGDLYESRSFIEKDGSFTLTGICPGPTRVSIELPAVLQEDYEIAKGQVDLNPRPGETLTGISLILRKKAKPVITTFTASKAPSLSIKVSPELVPRGAEPEITLNSSQELSEVKVILPTGEAFRLEGQGANWHGRIPIPDNASSGALLLKVEALDTKGSIWTRILPVAVADTGKLLDASLSPAAIYAGQKTRLSIKSLTAMSRIEISLPWQHVEYEPNDPYLWEAEYVIPEKAAPGRYTVTLRITSSRGKLIEERLTLVIR